MAFSFLPLPSLPRRPRAPRASADLAPSGIWRRVSPPRTLHVTLFLAAVRQLHHGRCSRSVFGPTCPFLAFVLCGDLPFHALTAAVAAPLPSPLGVGSGPGARYL